MGKPGLWNEACSHCGQPIPYEWNVELLRRRRETLAKNKAEKLARGEKTGRPRIFDRNKIRVLRNQGKTMRQIAKEIGCSTFVVQRAVRESNPASG